MRRRTRLLTVGLLVLVVALSAMACEKRTPKQSSSPSSGSGSSSTAEATRTAAPEITELKATMKGEGGSQVTGTATLLVGSPGTKISVEVKSLPAGQHAAYIYHQSCAGTGERHGPLATFATEGDTSTSTTNFVSLALAHFGDEPHFIVVHTGPNDNPGPAISCGKIE